MEFKDLLGLIASFLNVGVVGIAAFFAYRIGMKQNKINEHLVKLNDYADIFLMSQSIIAEGIIVGYNILIKNASAFPIYINSYTINGETHEVGASALSSLSDTWYWVPVSKYIQSNGYFSITVYFEDYSGRKYKTEGVGRFIENTGWAITSKKRIVLS